MSLTSPEQPVRQQTTRPELHDLPATPETCHWLADRGCDYGQGYHFARPLDADAAYALLVARNT